MFKEAMTTSLQHLPIALFTTSCTCKTRSKWSHCSTSVFNAAHTLRLCVICSYVKAQCLFDTAVADSHCTL